MEKRRWPRTGCLERCQVDPTTSGSHSMSSRVMNYSFTGLLLESDYPLRKGETVKIWLKDLPAEKELANLTLKIGMVRWCSKQTGDFSAMYEVGIEMVGGIEEQHN